MAKKRTNTALGKPIPLLAFLLPQAHFGGRSLEEEVALGDSTERSQTDWNTSVTLNACPELVKSTNSYLTGKSTKANSAAAISRYATRNGLSVLQQIPEIGTLRKRKEKAYLKCDELARMNLANQKYDFNRQLCVTNVHMKCYVYRWVEGALFQLADDLSLSLSTVVTLALIAGFAQSTTWVPSAYRDKFVNEIEEFKRCLRRRVQNR